MKNSKLTTKKRQLFSLFTSITPKILLSIITVFLIALPSSAAERIFLTYKSFKLSVRVDSLRKFAETGVANSDLGFYLRFVNEQEQEQFRTALNQRAQIDPVLLARLLNTDIGEDILTRLGKVLNIPWRLGGKYAIRGALIKASFQPEGLTLLSFLQQFPTNLQVDVDRSLAVARELDRIATATQFMMTKMAELTDQEAKLEPPVNFAKLPDLSQPGPYGSVSETITLNDSKRQRQFRVVFYRPERWKEGKTPVVMISHGLASRPEDLEGISRHLASYGYFVALPQHPGSDLEQAQALIDGFSRQVFYLNEFIDRPLDITYVLDYLEKQNQVQYNGRLNLTQVGMIGHSFGGYVAFALAGAQIDFEHLSENCNLDQPRLNLSLLLQCRALKLPRQEYDFKDKRVTSVIVLNPVNNSIFGPEGLGKIKIPVFMIAGSYDPATPAVFEQFSSFPWFTSSDKYLALVEGQAHVDFSQLDPGIFEAINSLNVVTLAPEQLLERYTNSIFLAFSQVYIAKNESYRPYLTSISNYSQYLSQGEEFKLFIVTDKSSPEIEKIMRELGFINTYRVRIPK